MKIKYYGNYDLKDNIHTELITGDYITQRNYFKYSQHEFIPDYLEPDIIFDVSLVNFYFKYIINPKKIVLVPQYNGINKIEKFNKRYINYLIFRCNKEKEDFFKDYNEDIMYKIIPIYFDINEFEMNFYKIEKQKPVIYLNGVLSRKIKQIEPALEKLVKINDIEVWWQTGDSKLFNLTNSNIKQFRMPPIMPYLQNRFITLNLIYNSDIVLIPSIKESFGRLVIEGLHFYKKIITTEGTNAIYDLEPLIDKMIFITKPDLSDLEYQIERALKSDFRDWGLILKLLYKYFDFKNVEEFDKTLVEWKVYINV